MKRDQKFLWGDAISHKKIIDILCSEKVIVGDSDTVPGLLVLATKHGHQQLDSIKGRGNKPYLLLVASKQKLEQFVDTKSIDELGTIISAFWPGPLTIIMNAKKEIKPPVCTKEGTIAVRIPDHVGLQAVLAHVNALFSTSANLSGEPVADHVDQISPEILRKADAIVYGDKQELLPSSTIIDCTKKPYKIIREGAIKKEKIQEIIDS